MSTGNMSSWRNKKNITTGIFGLEKVPYLE